MTKGIYLGSYVNSRYISLLVLFKYIAAASFIILSLNKIGSRILMGQDLGTINERARLYVYMPLIPVLNGTRLGISPCRY